MANIFLTGALQTGKSTVIDHVLDRCPCLIGGFRTWFRDGKNAPSYSLYLGDAFRRAERQAALFSGGRPVEIFTGCFDEYGALLVSTPAELIVMDELGRFEKRARHFQAAVFSVLGSPADVLGVLRHDAGGWLDLIRARPDVQIITVTEENRDYMPDMVLEMLEAG